jgi:hypothetical protein
MGEKEKRSMATYRVFVRRLRPTNSPSRRRASWLMITLKQSEVERYYHLRVPRLSEGRRPC